MSFPTRTPFALAAAWLLLGAATADAASKPITGKLSKSGYRVVATTAEGKSKTVLAKGGTFSIVPAGNVVVLNLVDAKGHYAGPVVVGIAGKKVVFGVKAGAKLGSIKIGTGLATAKAAKKDLVPAAAAAATKGKPSGVGRSGLVKGKATGKSGQGRDQDGDGIIGAFDIDDDGDLVIDNLDRGSAKASAAQAPMDPPNPGGPQGPPNPGQPQGPPNPSGPQGPPNPGQPQGPVGGPAPGPGGGGSPTSEFRVFSNFKLDISESVNANGGGLDRLGTVFPRTATLAIAVPMAPVTAEMDCLGLSYCSLGGTGTTLAQGPTPGKAFPGEFDADGDGQGTLEAGQTGDFQLSPNAAPSAIGSGDAFIEHLNNGGTETEVPGVLNFIFKTNPGLTEFAVEGGASGSVSYPVAPGQIGTSQNPITVPADSAKATLTFWRPQRSAVGDEAASSAGYVDIGGLTYVADIPNGPSGGPGSPGSQGPGSCRSGYTTSDSDATLGTEGIVDTVADRAADPANTLTFTIDLQACLGSVSWASGQTLAVDIQAKSQYGDNAAQKIFFKRA